MVRLLYSFLILLLLCFFTEGKKPTIILQLSDLHLSTNKHGKFFKHFGDREKDLRTFSSNVIPALSPSSILITGDLTDAKTVHGSGLQQESEWIAYREAIDHMVESTDISEHLIFDVKGNHDAFNVPLRGGDWDYWPSYAVEGRRSGPTKRIFINQIYPPSSTTTTKEEKEQQQAGGPPPCPSVTLLGIDASAHTGLKSPANFCGHITPDMLREIHHELTKLDDTRPGYCSKPSLIVYSHFPLPTLDHRPAPDLASSSHTMYTSSSQHTNTTTTAAAVTDDDDDVVYAMYSKGGVTGALHHLTHKITSMQGLGELLASHEAVVYVSGHLHSVFGERLHAVHSYGKSGHKMIEMENAAWKDDRRFRLMSIDDDTITTTTNNNNEHQQGGGFTYMDLYFHTPTSPKQENRGDKEAMQDALWKRQYKSRGWAVTATDRTARVIDHIPMITWPPDARYQAKKRAGGETAVGAVNAMVFPLHRTVLDKMTNSTTATKSDNNNDNNDDAILPVERVTLVTRLSSGVKLLEHDMQVVDDTSSNGGIYYTAAPEITVYCPKGAHGGGGSSSSHYHAQSSSGSSRSEEERACSDGVKHVEIQVVVKYKNNNNNTVGKHVGIKEGGGAIMESRSVLQPAMLKCSSNRNDGSSSNGGGKSAVSETCRIIASTELLPLGTSNMEKTVLAFNLPVFAQRFILLLWLIQVVVLLLVPRILFVKYVPQLLTAPLFTPSELKQHAVAAGYFGTMTVRAWRACLGALLWPFVALCIMASVSEVWLPWLLYSAYLIVGPWLVADLLSGRPPALMFWYGVSGKFSDGVNVGLGQAAALNWQYIATPDTMLISLAHFIGCVVPVTLWIACVVARRVQLSTNPAGGAVAAGSLTSPGRNTSTSSGKNQSGGSSSSALAEGPTYKMFSTLQLLFFTAMVAGNIMIIYIKAAHLMGPLCLIVSPGLTGTLVLAIVLVRWKKFGAIAKKGKPALTASGGGGKR